MQTFYWCNSSFVHIYKWHIGRFFSQIREIHLLRIGDKVREKFSIQAEIFLEQREGAFLSPSKIRENLNFSTEIQILLGDKNAPYLCSKIISTLPPSSSFDKTSFMDVP